MTEKVGKIAMSTLGSNGRFGNQIFQYAFLKICAEVYDLNVETPYWIGQDLFGHNDPKVSKYSSILKEEEIDFSIDSFLNKKLGLYDVDLWGYFLYHTNLYRRYKDLFCSLFKPTSSVISHLDQGLGYLKNQGKTVVGIHMRRGDFSQHHYLYNSNNHSSYFVAPSKWYLQYLEGLWDTLDNPVLFVASDEPDKILKDFKIYDPITSKDLSITIPEAEFYPDFYFLSMCDVMAISNSTFSFAASMLNDKCKIFARPHLSANKLVPYDPWNSYPVLSFHAKYYPSFFVKKMYRAKSSLYAKLKRVLTRN